MLLNQLFLCFNCRNSSLWRSVFYPFLPTWVSAPKIAGKGDTTSLFVFENICKKINIFLPTWIYAGKGWQHQCNLVNILWFVLKFSKLSKVWNSFEISARKMCAGKGVGTSVGFVSTSSPAVTSGLLTFQQSCQKPGNLQLWCSPGAVLPCLRIIWWNIFYHILSYLYIFLILSY